VLIVIIIVVDVVVVVSFCFLFFRAYPQHGLRALSTAGPLQSPCLPLPLRVTARSIAQFVCPRLKNPKQKENFMTDIPQKPLNKLVASLDNLRGQRAWIRHCTNWRRRLPRTGCCSPSWVRKYKKGWFALVAGERRTRGRDVTES
jgi:hypothetical protein